MDCCDNKNITYKNYENVCVNCGTIHDYRYVNEVSFRDFIIQIYKEYPSICQYKHLAAAVGLTDRYLRPIPC